jgi:hypothetical protein
MGRAANAEANSSEHARTIRRRILRIVPHPKTIAPIFAILYHSHRLARTGLFKSAGGPLRGRGATKMRITLPSFGSSLCRRGSYRLPREGADRSGLNDCHSRICSDTSAFSRSSVALSQRRRSSSSLASTNPARPDFGAGFSRLPYPMLGLLLFLISEYGC